MRDSRAFWTSLVSFDEVVLKIMTAKKQSTASAKQYTDSLRSSRKKTGTNAQ